MVMDLWLPKGFELPDGSKIRSIFNAGYDWQIFDTNGSDNVLLALPELVQKWHELGFIDKSLFQDLTFGIKSFRILNTPKKFILTVVENGKSPENKVDALAFAFALKESRKISNGVSFHDAIYVEQYSRLLPTWTPSPYVDDQVVLGTWITGGVAISTESFRRLNKLTGWLPVGDLVDIVKTAGLNVPSDASIMVKHNFKSHERRDERETIAKDNMVEPDRLQTSEDLVNPTFFKLPGRPYLEEFFNEHVIDIIFNNERYQALGIDFPSAIVLHGPPGCGKTYAVERLVEFIDWPSYSIDSNSVGSPFIHETSKKISEVFDKAIDSAPSVIVIDEMESFLSERRSGSSSGLHHIEEVAEFLRRIPEAIKNKVLIIAMTNLIEIIDPAILRRGRFDHIIEVGMPSREEVASLIDSLLKNLPKEDDINLNNILDALTGKALSDSAFVVREAARLAARAGKIKIGQECIEAALNSLPNEQEKKERRIGF